MEIVHNAEAQKFRDLEESHGYLSTDYHHFNKGKQDEVKHRVKHNGIEVTDNDKQKK